MNNAATTRILGLHPWPFWLIVGMVTVIAFNLWLMMVAIRNHDEPVTTQPYIDGLHHEQFLEAQRAFVGSGLQAKLFLESLPEESSPLLLLALVTTQGAPVERCVVNGSLLHLSGRNPSIEGIWSESSAGRYRSPGALGSGLWSATLWLQCGGEKMALVEQVKVP